MQLHGLSKTTLLDFPGYVSATLFTGGCNFRCPFCHNGDLVLNPGSYPAISEEEVFTFLKKRKGVLKGVCITGGEPTLQPDLEAFIGRIKDLGYLVKLDTNGYRPDVLNRLLSAQMLDYVAMDIKNSPEHYGRTIGIANPDMGRIRQSATMLTEGTCDYEFRTTVVRELHTAEDFESVGRWLTGAKQYFLQGFTENDNCIEQGYSAYDKETMLAFAEILQKYGIPAKLRGID